MMRWVFHIGISGVLDIPPILCDNGDMELTKEYLKEELTFVKRLLDSEFDYDLKDAKNIIERLVGELNEGQYIR